MRDQLDSTGLDAATAAPQPPRAVAPADLNAPPTFAAPWMPRSDRQTPSGTPKDDVSFLIDPEADEEDGTDTMDQAMSAAPPWLISLAVHMSLIVALGLWAISNVVMNGIDLDLSFSPTFGDQLEEDSFALDAESLTELPIVTPEDMTVVEDPLASPHTVLDQLPNQLVATASFEAPNIGLALSGREAGMKEALLLAYGGDKLTEGAVAEALKWLKRQQSPDGAWRLNGPYQDGSSVRNPVAATAMALLAFQGAGFTHLSSRQMLDADGQRHEVDYRRVVRRGWDKLLEWQAKDGNFWEQGRVDHPHHLLYSQAQATIAICELYGMTKDQEFREPAQRAVNYCVEIQDRDGSHPDGGWKYDPHHDSDMSVTGWFVMALQSARMAGLDVPSDVFARVAEFLDSVSDDGSFYAYMPGYASKLALTAEGLLCRQYLGWPRDDERLTKGVEYLARNPVTWDNTNTYYWYYATQVMHHMEGDEWFEWNRVMAKELPKKQVRSGPERGSWSPDNDIWGQGGGRLYMTCLCTYMLEVYYRHLPLYSNLH